MRLNVQVAILLGLQAAMVVLAVFAAASALRIRERHPFSRDAYHGFRPPVGDDPVFWREFTLPFRGAKQLLIVAQVRQIVILVRIMLTLVLRLLVMTMAVAVPIGLVIATARYGYFAFLELASDGYFPEGPAAARRVQCFHPRGYRLPCPATARDRAGDDDRPRHARAG